MKPLLISLIPSPEWHARFAFNCMKVRVSIQRCIQCGLSIAGIAAMVAIAGCSGGGGASETVTVNQPPPIPPPEEMTLLAGTFGSVGNTDGVPGRFNQPGGVATDALGNIYVADSGNNTIRKVTATGVITLAGKSGTTGSADGLGTAASFNKPVALALDSTGNVYVDDLGNGLIRMITPAGAVSTFARAAGNFGIAVDETGTVFLADQTQLRKITPVGVVSSLATGFNALSSLALDRVGNVYVTDAGASVIRKISPAGTITTIAGTLSTSDGTAPFGFADGGPGVAKFDHPSTVVADASGTLFVLDNQRIRKVTPDGIVTSLAATNADGTAFAFPGNGHPASMAIAADGSIFFSVPDENVIKKMTPSRSIVAVAGTPVVSGTADGTGAAARFSGPGDLAVDGGGNIIVVDTLGNSIRKIAPTGVVTTLASSVRDRSVNPPGGNSSPALLLGLAIDKSGALFVADPNLHLIRRIGIDGSKTIVAGSTWSDGVNTCGFCGIFTGRSKPVGVAVDSAGTLFVPDGEIIRKVPAGDIDTILACTNLPTCVAAGKVVEAITVDKADNLYAAQAGVIFKITPAGASSVLAGGGTVKFSDGIGSNASFGVVQALTVDAAGNVFVADTTNNAVRRITPSGVVSTTAGSAGAVGVVLGTLPASLSAPAGIAIDATGVLYVSSENAVLRIKP